jgi:hypothetical protein
MEDFKYDFENGCRPNDCNYPACECNFRPTLIKKEVPEPHEETPIEFIERRFVTADGIIEYSEQFKGYLENQLRLATFDIKTIKTTKRSWKEVWGSCLSFEEAKEILRDNHMINIRIRKDGEWHEFDADWMKTLVQQEFPKK